MAWPPGASENPLSLHGVCAVSFFVSITYVCIFQASATLTLVTGETKRKRYRWTYKVLGVAMLASPAIAFILSLLPWFRSSLIFFIEAAGVYVFALYWLVKSREIRETAADQKAAGGKLQVPQPDKLSDAFREFAITSMDDEWSLSEILHPLNH